MAESDWFKRSLKIYIEGDGDVFDSYREAIQNLTPHGTLIREINQENKNANIIYLARLCQYVQSSVCSEKYWASARFSSQVIQSEYEAVQMIVGQNPVILVGFSGGAQVAGLIAAAKP